MVFPPGGTPPPAGWHPANPGGRRPPLPRGMARLGSRAPRTGALVPCQESGTRRRRVVRASACPCSLTAGRNGRGWSSPRCVKPQAAVFFAVMPRRPDPFFFFGVKDRFFFRRKRNGLSPPEGIRPPQVGTLPVRAAAGRPYPGGWRAGSSRPTTPGGSLAPGREPLVARRRATPPGGPPRVRKQLPQKVRKKRELFKKSPV